MAVFEIGDKVETVDDTIIGTVVAIYKNEVTIESAEGFQFKFSPSELVKTHSDNVIKVTNYEVAQIKKEKELPKKKPKQSVKPKQRNAPRMVVDLHINQLVRSTKGLNNFDMLNLQLEAAKRQLRFAIDKRIQKIVFIHGVGEGVLKEELYALFRRYQNITFYDADYQQYGMGATEVYIYQNP
ncbi:Smr/MutS family protein [Flavobacteriaceae bacterium TP-CH-4]|uniref:Smr/MutS family protein n=1 Tax=Pelagihabitans pacificus TaxID=2696054 RepID=A0A967E824_9FLAO|nr:Smr/MutS family protein [Pelagihabitans pacificus]NHF61215.1 Smr/MutS family protein [Pelagihabitans pacificus]